MEGVTGKQQSPVNRQGEPLDSSEQLDDQEVNWGTDQRAGQPGAAVGQPGSTRSSEQQTTNEGAIQQSGKKVTKSKWVYKSNKCPSSLDIKRILAIVVKYMLKTIFSNHVYIFKGKIYLQTDKGPIGLRFTGSVARLILIYFDNIFMDIAIKAGIKIVLYRRFVDDINCCSKVVKYGMKYCKDDQTIKYCQDQYEEDIQSGMSVQAKTFSILKLIANSIVDMISWEVDLPEYYPDRRIPVLDLKVGLDNTDTNAPIRHSYYQKPMASKLVIS